MIENPQSLTDLTSLNDNARVWVFQSSKELIGDIRTDVSSTILNFLKDWAAHGKSLFAAFEVRYDRFIVVAVDEAMAQATGCSIDKLVRTMQDLDSKHDLGFLERMKVAYRDGEEIKEVDVNTFTQMLADGRANGQTPVFNNVVQNIAELNSGWETTVASSWQKNLMP